MAKKQKAEDYAKNLKQSFDSWEHYKEYGGSDPFYTDGCNMNLIRNHIIYAKRKIEETMSPENYPEIYHRETPLEVDRDYMARPDEIREAAKKSLSLYLSNKDYNYLLQQVNLLDKEKAKEICIKNIINYAVGLENAIEKDDLVCMRRHSHAESYISSFTSCANKIRLMKFNKFKSMIINRKVV